MLYFVVEVIWIHFAQTRWTWRIFSHYIRQWKRSVHRQRGTFFRPCFLHGSGSRIKIDTLANKNDATAKHRRLPPAEVLGTCSTQQFVRVQRSAPPSRCLNTKEGQIAMCCLCSFNEANETSDSLHQQVFSQHYGPQLDKPGCWEFVLVPARVKRFLFLTKLFPK